LEGEMFSSAARKTRALKGITAQEFTNATGHSAQLGSYRNGNDPSLSPRVRARMLTSPSSARRNFHTLPLTTGGSAQTNTITASTTSDQRPAVRSAIAAASPPIMPTAVTTTTNTRVRQRASVVAPLVQ